MERKPSYYAVIPSTVRYDKDLSASEKLLYGEITALANKQGYCFATNSYFSNLYKVSDRTIIRWINKLEGKGYINKQIIYGDNNECIERRIYLCNKMSPPHDINVTTPTDTDVTTPHDINVTTPHDINVTHNNTSINNTSINNTSINSNVRQPHDTNKRQTSDKQVTTTKEYKEYKEYKEDEEYIYIDHFDYKAKFNEFWSEYPKKIAKQKCLDKFKKICTTDETFSAIMTGLRKYNELQYQFTDTQFIPNPLTWLNQERWLDEIHDKRPKNLKQKNNTTFYHEVEPPSYFREQKDLNIENITENDIKSRINNLKIPPVERGM